MPSKIARNLPFLVTFSILCLFGTGLAAAAPQSVPGEPTGDTPTPLAVAAGTFEERLEGLAVAHLTPFLGSAVERGTVDLHVDHVTLDQQTARVALQSRLDGQPIAGGTVTMVIDTASYDIASIGHQLLASDDLAERPSLGFESAFHIASTQADAPIWASVTEPSLRLAVDSEGSIRHAWSAAVSWLRDGFEYQGLAFVDATNGELIRLERTSNSGAAATDKGLFTPPSVGTVSKEQVDACGHYILSWYSVAHANVYEVFFTTGGSPGSSAPPATSLSATPSSVPQQICVGATAPSNGKFWVRGCNVGPGFKNCGGYGSVSVGGPSPLCGSGGSF